MKKEAKLTIFTLLTIIFSITNTNQAFAPCYETQYGSCYNGNFESEGYTLVQGEKTQCETNAAGEEGCITTPTSYDTNWLCCSITYDGGYTAGAMFHKNHRPPSAASQGVEVEKDWTCISAGSGSTTKCIDDQGTCSTCNLEPCTTGPITERCTCEGNRLSGYCLNTKWYPICTQDRTITTTCVCEGDARTAGVCMTGDKWSGNIPEFSTTTLIITTITSILIIGLCLRKKK